MSQSIILISTGMTKQSEAFEEPGINSIAAYLRAKGYDVVVKLVLHEQLDLADLMRQTPMLIGFSVYADTFGSVSRLCRRIKESLPGTYIVLGGYAPSYYTKEVLRDIPWADAVIIGEGEIPTAELADYLCGSIDIEEVHNLAYRSDYEVIFNEKADPIRNMDTLPFSARDIAQQYDPSEIWVSTARGCTRSCAFCCSQHFWRNRETHNWRGRSVGDVVKEIQHLVSKFGIRQFEFIDNSFEDPYPYLEREMNLATAILENDLKVAYGANMRAETCAILTEQQIILLKDSGFSYVYLGIEGFNHNSLRVYRKTATVDLNKKALSLLAENDIPVDIGFINFNPYISFDDLRGNIHNLQEYGMAFLQYILTFLYIFRGTALYKRVKEDGLLYKDDSVEDFLCYHYSDSRVEKVANYLISCKKRFEYCGIMNEGYFIVYLRKKSAQLVNLMKKFDFFDTDMEEYMRGLNSFLDLRRQFINQVSTDWFLRILALGEADFSECKALEITEKFLTTLDGDEFEKLREMKNILYSRAYKKFFKSRIRIR